MNVNVSIGGVSTSARARALALVRNAIAKREEELASGVPRSTTARAGARGGQEPINLQATRGR
jgi:hypothetical protein